MSGSIPIQIRGTPSNGPPVGLVERQLAVEMDTGNLWVGVPVSIDSTGRIMLNPRRTPAGGERYDYLMRGTGTTLQWNPLGNRIGNNTAGGYGSMDAMASGTNNTAWGNATLRTLASGNFNVAIGNGALTVLAGVSSSNIAIGANAAGAVTACSASIFLGYGAAPSANGNTSEVVIGASAVGHGSNTATIGTDSGPDAMTQFWVGGRDLLVTGQAYFDEVNFANAPNDDTVRDVVTLTVPAGLWIVALKASLATATATPWIHYGAGINLAPGQTSIEDTAEWRTVSSTTYAATFRHTSFENLLAPTQVVGCVQAANATNSGIYGGSLSLQAIRLAYSG